MHFPTDTSLRDTSIGLDVAYRRRHLFLRSTLTLHRPTLPDTALAVSLPPVIIRRFCVVSTMGTCANVVAVNRYDQDVRHP